MTTSAGRKRSKQAEVPTMGRSRPCVFRNREIGGGGGGGGGGVVVVGGGMGLHRGQFGI